MGKKKYILLILLLLIPAIIGTGVSTWIIINEQPIKNPEYNYEVVTNKYVSYESVIYNGDIQLPVINDLIDEEVTLWYRESGETSFVEITDYKNPINGPKNAGLYEFKAVPTGIEEQYVESVHGFEIKKKTLDVELLEAKVTYGDELTETTYTSISYTGFVEGEDISNVTIDTTNFAFANSAYTSTTPCSSVVTVQASGLESTNYDFKYLNSDLTIEQRTVVLNWGSNQLTYTGYEQLPSLTIDNIVNGDIVQAIYEAKFRNANTDRSWALLEGKSAYSANVTGLTNANYKLPADTDYDFYICKALLTIVTESGPITFGDAPRGFGLHQINGLLDGDSESVVNQTNLDYTYTYNQYDDYGTYNLTAKGLTADNYEFDYVAGTLNVLQKEIELTWSNLVFTYLGTEYCPTVTIDKESQLVKNHITDKYIDCVVSTLEITGPTINQKAINAGNYNVACIAISNDNYVVKASSKDVDFVINPRDITQLESTTTIEDLTYNGTSQDLNSKVKIKDYIESLSKDIITTNDYTLTFSETKNAIVDAVCTVVGKANYTGTYTFNYDIAPYTLTAENIEWTNGDTFVYINSVTEQYPTMNFINLFGSDTITITSDSGREYLANYKQDGTKLEGRSDYVYKITGISNPNYALNETDFARPYKIFTKPVPKDQLHALPKESLGNERLHLINYDNALITLTEPIVYTYDGQAHLPFVWINSSILSSHDVCRVVVIGEQVNAGDDYIATVTALTNNNYELVELVDIPFVINPRSMSDNSEDFEITIEDQVYDGTAKTPEVVIVDKGIVGTPTLTLGTDYTVEYSNNVHAGTAQVSISGINNYEGSLSATFEIKKRSITEITTSVSDVDYTGQAQEPTVTVTNTHAPIESSDYIITYSDNIDAGTATVTITATDEGNYSGTTTTTFTIKQRDISEVFADIAQITYTGEELEPAVTITNTYALIKASDYVIDYFNNINAGNDAYIVITGQNNYKGTKTVYFRIDKADFDMTGVTISNQSVTYDGNTHPLAISGTLPTGVSVSYENNAQVNVGTYTVIAVFTHSNPNYNPVPNKTATLTITPRDISEITATAPNVDYNGSAQTPTVTINNDSNAPITGSDYIISYSNNTNAGTAVVTITGISNYTGTKVINFTINRINLTITADDKTKVYGTSDPALTYTASGFVGTDGNNPSITLERETGENVGTYDITVSYSNDNYIISLVPGTFEITKATHNMNDISFSGKTTEYNGEVHSLAISGELPSGVTVTYENNDHINAGSYTVTAKFIYDTDNYNTIANMTATLVITARNITLTANNSSAIYGKEYNANGYTVSVGEILANDLDSLNIKAVVDTTIINSTTGVGTYEDAIYITYTENSNYVVTTVKGDFEITNESVENAVITINNPDIIYTGQEITPAITVKYGDKTLVQGDDYTVEYDNNVNAGTGIITITGTGNYSGTNSITFSIAKAELIITADNKTKVYGDALPALTVSYVGFVNGETYTVLDGELIIETEAKQNSVVGTYAITASGLTSSNYEITYKDGVLEVTKAPLTIKVKDASKVYGTENPTFEVEYSGFVLGENEDVLTRAYVYTTEATTNSNVGTYEVTVTGASSANYEITYQAGTLTIIKAEQTIDFTGLTDEFIFNGEAHAISGAEAQGEITYLPATVTLAGSYTIKVTAAETENYNSATYEVTVTVNKADPIYEVPENLTAVYGSTLESIELPEKFSWAENPNHLVGNVGTNKFMLTFTPIDTNNFNIITNIEVDVVVTPKALTITGSSHDIIFGDEIPAITVTYNGFVEGEDETVLEGTKGASTNYAKYSSIGTYKVVPNQLSNANYEITYVEGTITVTEETIKDTDVTLEYTSKTYTGSALEPIVTVIVEDVTLEKETDFTVTYSNNTNKGTAIVTVKGINNYKGTIEKSFEITSDSLNDAQIEILDTEIIYNGSELEPSIKVTYNGKTLTETTDYIVTYTNNTNAGTATVTIEGTGNYEGSTFEQFEIKARNISEITAETIVSADYIDAEIRPDVTITNGITITEDDYEITYSNNVNAGIATITITGKRNYTGTKEITFTINKLNLTITAENKEKVYNTADPAFTYTSSGFVGDDADGITVTYIREEGETVGTYTITPVYSNANYDVTCVPGTLTINKATHDMSDISFNGTTVEYDGETHSLEISGVLPSGVSVSYENNGKTNAGKHTVVAKFAYDTTNYNTIEDMSAVLEITALEITLTANNSFGVYGTTYEHKGYTVSSGEILEKDLLGLNIQVHIDENIINSTTSVGTHKDAIYVTYTENINYVITTVKGEFEITNETINGATITINEDNIVYSGTAKTPSITVKLGEKELELNTEYTVTYTNNTSSGTATITVSGINNYSGTATKDFTIKQAPLTITVDNSSKVYGAVLPEFTIKYSGFVNGETESVVTGDLEFTTLATVSSNVGEYDVIASGLTASNYSITFVKGALEVTKAPLTVTVNPATKVYGTDNPTFSVTYSGFVLDQTESVLSGNLVFTTTATKDSDVGSYVVKASGLSSDNYAITYVDGTLTITQAEQTINVDLLTKVFNYNGSEQTISGATAHGAITYSPATVKNAGKYNITISAAATKNYKAATTTVEVEVLKANPEYTKPTGLVATYGQTLGNITLPTGFSWTNETTTSVGNAGDNEFTVIYTPTDTANYNVIEDIEVVVAVAKKALTITGSSHVLTYGDDVPEIVVTYDGFVNGEDQSVLTGTKGATTTYVKYSSIGTYEVIPNVLTSANYNITYENGSITVGKQIIAETDVTLEYTEASFTGSALTPAVTVVVEDRTLVKDTDYTITYANNTNKGTATVTITAKGNYDGIITKNFTISSESLSTAEITVLEQDIIYSGTAKTPNIKVVYGTTELIKDQDYTVEYTNNTNAGTATIKVTGTGNYSGTATKDFTIEQAPLTITVDNSSKVYGAALPEFTIKYSGFVNGETESVVTGDLEFTTLATVSSNVGEYDVIASGLTASNYSITFVKGALEVTKAPLTVTVNPATKVYGTDNPTFSVTYSGFVLDQTESVLSGNLVFTTTATKDSDVGSYVVKASGLSSDNYAITYVDGTLTITQAEQTINVDALTKVFTYNGLDQTISGATAEGAITYSPATVKNAGKYNITISAAATKNYKAATTIVEVEVQKAKPTYDVPTGKEAVYGSTLATISLPDGFTWNEPTTNVGNVGSHTFVATYTPDDTDNYNINNNVNISVTVTKATLTITEIANSKVFGNVDPKLTYSVTGFVNNDEDSAVITLTREAGENVGTYDIITTYSNDNYEINIVDAKFTIIARTITDGVVTGIDASYIYTGSDIKPTVTLTVNDIVLTSGTHYDVAYANNKNIGTATVTITGKGNYEGTITKTFAITSFSIDMSGVTFTSKVVTYNKDKHMIEVANLPNTVTVTYKVNDAIFDGATNVGVYEIIATFTPKDPNHTLTKDSLTATLTIEQATIDMSGVVFSNKTVTYNGESHTITATNIPDNASVTYNGSGTNHGTYTITATFTSDDSNYKLSKSEFTATLTIEKADPTYTTPTGLTASYGSTLSDIDLPDGFTWNAPTTNVGNVGNNEFTVTYTPTDTNNYNILDNIKVTVNVTKVQLVITIIDSGKVFGNSDPELTYSVTGFVNNDLENASISVTREVGENVGEYTMTTNYTNGNYEVIVEDGTFTITARTINDATITGINATYTYNGSAHTPVPTVTVNGKTLVKDTDYTVSYNNNVTNGTATIIITGIGNYKDSINKEFQITAGSIDMSSVNFDSQTLTYDKATHMIYVTNLPDTVNVVYTVGGNVFSGASNVGVYEITATFTPKDTNYTLSVTSLTATLVINQATIDMSGVVFADKESAYTGSAQSITATNIPTNVDVRYEGEGTDVGEYTITAIFESTDPNYKLSVYSKTATLTIVKAVPSISNIKVVYDQSINEQVLNGFFTTIMDVNNITFTHDGIAGTITYVDVRNTLVIGTETYNIKFTPTDTKNYETINTTVSIVTYATVTFVDYNDDVLEVQYVAKGDSATTPSAPTREGYTFATWDTSYDNVTTNLTVKATYNVNKYKYVFYHENGTTVLSSGEVEYGQSIPTPTTPTKDSTAQYDYTFSGWTPSVPDTMPASDQSFKATFSSTVRSYSIKFVNWNGDLLQESTINYGETPVYTGETPTRTTDAQYSYVFKEWSPAIKEVDGEAIYTATYTTTTQSYTVNFVDWDNTVLSTQTVEYGQAAIAPSNPTRTGYTFKEWDKAYNNITGDLTVKAVYTINQYTIKFDTNGGTTIADITLDYGTTIPAVANPTRTGYTFKEWDQEIPETMPAENMTITASWTANTYTITFNANEGSVTPTSMTVTYDQPYVLPTPTRTGYTFAGWYKDSTKYENGTWTTDDNITLTASWTINQYTYTFYDEDGETVIKTATIDFGSTIVKPSDPTKAATAKYTYTFAGWTPEVPATMPANNVEFTATYTPTINKYTIVFKDYDGTVLQSTKVEYDAMPSLPANPERESDAQYSYVFAGWTPTVVTVTGDATYTATYDTTTLSYTITWVNEDGTVLETDNNVPYGTTPTFNGATPSKDSTAQYVYTFDGWTPSISSVTGDATYTATYSSTIRTYTVTWVNENGTVLETDNNVAYGATPNYDGETPTKGATQQYTYSFAGWSPAISKVTGDVTYTATYSETVIEYNITWIDGNGAILKTIAVPYGEIPVYSGETPTKEGNVQYTYTFNGKWSPEIVAVTESKAYTAQFDATLNKYTVVWKNYNGVVLETDTVEYGTVPTYDGSDPIKEGNAQFSYTFNGWDKDVVAVTGPATYTAKFLEVTNKYTITFENWDGTELQSSEVEYGKTPTFEGQVPSKPKDAQYTYTFNGWSPTIDVVTGAQTYKAIYTQTINTYTVTWKNEDGTQLEKDEEVPYGTTPSFDGTTPTKFATAQYSYTFNGWTPTVSKVTGDVTYTATYTATVNTYTVTWKNHNGDELEIDEEVPYGTKPSYNGTTPTKASDAQYSYNFTGWNPNIDDSTIVDGDLEFVAQFEQVTNAYTITYVNYDDSVLATYNVSYGVMPEYNGSTPAKPSDAQYTYTFNGWSPAISIVTGNATYKAQYSKTLNTYTVTWKNSDGSVLETDENVPFGTTPSYNGNTPTKAKDAQYTYTFNGWSPEVAAISGDTEYVATYSETINKYVIKFMNGDVVLQESEVEYGQTPSYNGATPSKASTAQYTYTFDGWDKDIVAVTGSATYNATFLSTVNEYTITWLNDDDTVIDTTSVAYGDTPTHANPSKNATAQYTYTFAGWSPTIESVTGEATYKATYTPTLRSYTVRFLDWDGTVLNTQTVVYGNAATAPANPTRTGYTFNEWDNTFTNITGDLDVTAMYIINTYTVTFESNGGTSVESQIINYNSTAVKPSDPTLANYTFVNWYSDSACTIVYDFNTPITSDITLYAKWKSALQLEISGTIVQSTTYNGSIQKPTVSVTLNGSIVDATVKFYDVNGTEVSPINANKYTLYAKATADGYEDSELFEIEFEITKANVTMNQLLELDYNSENTTWDKLISSLSIKNLITCTDTSNNVKLDATLFDIIYMHDGKYLFGDSKYISSFSDDYDTSLTNVAGSTYKVYVKLTTDAAVNYRFDKSITVNESNPNTGTTILKYKTALISSTYYTVEDAIKANSGLITFVGNSSSATSFILTAFTSLPSSDFDYGNSNSYNLSGRQIIVPYKEGSTASYTYDKNTYSTTSGNVYAALYIPSHIIINMSNSAKLTAAGQIGGGTNSNLSNGCTNVAIVTLRGVIVNDGIVNVNSGCKVEAYGYIKGKGSINFYSGSYGYDVLKINDWPGGSATLDLYETVFPIASWTLHNMSCVKNVYAGAIYYAYSGVYLTGLETQELIDIPIIGSYSTTNCIFKPISQSDTTSYIKISTYDTADILSITGLNQLNNQKSKFEINGNYSDAQLYVSKTFLGMGVKMQSSTSVSAPISNFDVTICSGSILNLINADYAFLPGTTVIIEEDAEVTIGSNVDISFAKANDLTGTLYYSRRYNSQDAYMIVNGSLTVNGSIGGKVLTEGPNATLNLTNGNNISTFKLAKSGATYNTYRVLAYGNILSSTGTTSPFSSGMYYSKYINDRYQWYCLAGTISFELEGGQHPSDGTYENIDVEFGDNGLPFDESYLPTIDPIKSYYEFGGWILQDGTNPVGTTIYSSITLVPIWNPIDYNIVYDMNNYDSSCDSSIARNPVNDSRNPLTFNANSSLLLYKPTNIVDYDGNEYKYVFGGWYLDEEYTIKLTNIDGSECIERLSSFADPDTEQLTIYGLWYPQGTEEYTITYVLNPDDIDIITGLILMTDGYEDQIIETVVSSKLSTYNLFNFINENKYNKFSMYFAGWYDNENFTNDPYTASDITGNITLYARWDKKLKVTLNYDGVDTSVDSTTGIPNNEYYYIPSNSYGVNSNFILPSDITNNETRIWFNNNMKNSTTYYIGGINYADIVYNDSGLTLYGEYYYVISSNNFSYDTSTIHTNVLLKDLDLRNKYTYSVSVSVNASGTSITGYSSTVNITKTNNSPFVNKGISKLIIENCDFSPGVANSGSDTTGIFTRVTMYGFGYTGLFDDNNLSQIIIKNTTLGRIGNYNFVNQTSTLSSTSFITQTSVDVEGTYYAKDNKTSNYQNSTDGNIPKTGKSTVIV